MFILKKCKDTFSEYHGNPALGKSNLHKMGQSPAHFKQALDNLQESTSAMQFGTAFHTIVLEPERFEEEFVVVGKIDRRTKEGKAEAERIEQSGLIPINEADYFQLCAMRDSVMSNRYAVALLAGEKEMSYYWTDEMTGVDVKCRPDCRTDLKFVSVIVDLKTCGSAATDNFVRDIYHYGYDLQAAQYKTGVEMYEKKPHKFVFIAVEKQAPFAINIIDIDDVFNGDERAAIVGYDKFREYLGLVAECRLTGIWYDYVGCDEVIGTSTIPDWIREELR